MYTLGKLIHVFFPLIALVLFIIGIKKNAISYIISSLWLSLIALLIHFQFSGNQIFGTYFNYFNAGIYSFNFIILLIALLHIMSHLSIRGPAFKYTYTLINSLLVAGTITVITNLWINAYFIENKMEGTPVMQVALFTKPEYCGSKYVFYKIDPDSSVMYLCPNYYGFLPSIGHLATSPDFITMQLSAPVKKQLLLKNKNKS
ncbi:type I secretion system protein LssZ [Fluoribacter dumoffii]|uniref:Type I secretion system LssZ n=1 Tax=Fluoribacter dumoffii TaxID=463 RepID=A0A377G9R1_9GAMM|nr:type I secretion system protein LssZ [Fluoribacter dumoffii]KTC89049.1 type I secretion system LssZ [Fluoribacter dumoffii NY 23]MCW8385743.1 type I secretion system protein LssZ [Fluoribacter dumoffii]MCW8418773.1 type I secretion system protein LssZ [Fluoribacter dumoffii]MCW8453383.1 type I secretion system protein LssZ [Fluoribacter dumoffii]MCW8459396.1 type I secretion system protein LssZ [Fluoribacter dumoffii]